MREKTGRRLPGPLHFHVVHRSFQGKNASGARCPAISFEEFGRSRSPWHCRHLERIGGCLPEGCYARCIRGSINEPPDLRVRRAFQAGPWDMHTGCALVWVESLPGAQWFKILIPWPKHEDTDCSG
ncbi:hypothetical protein KM043_005462 [Ampulex compressa]|nr:hypothetical protein KM043_005462 [Ampulex compressa]